jgi:predicted nucleotidyltransferase
MNINEIKTKVAKVASQYGVEQVFLFGSYARGEARPDSDIDICIKKGNVRTLLELSGFYLDLEESLGQKVDVVTTESLQGDFKRNIEKDLVAIYDAE